MSFDALAPHYRWMELVLAGRKLQRCRTAFLPAATRSRRILLLGEGNGRFLVPCRRAATQARITCVDASARMLQLARARARRAGLDPGQIEFLQADALTWQPPPRTFDLIVTHFFLDCFRPDQLKKVIARLADAACPGAIWLLADFQLPPRGWRRCRAWAIHRLMYLFFRVATRLPALALTPPDPLLEQCGFTLRDRKLSDWELLRSDRWERAEVEE